MKWEKAPTLLRLTCLLLGIGSFVVAWHLTKIGSSGIEDVPPPFILMSGIAGIGFLSVAIIGRYPWPDSTK